MAAKQKYPSELRERATRLVLDALKNPETSHGAVARVARQLSINADTLRGWVKQAEIDTGTRPGVTTAESARIAELERENRELRRANQILKSASAFFAAELDRPSR
jgi:transposase